MKLRSILIAGVVTVMVGASGCAANRPTDVANRANSVYTDWGTKSGTATRTVTRPATRTRSAGNRLTRTTVGETASNTPGSAVQRGYTRSALGRTKPAGTVNYRNTGDYTDGRIVGSPKTRGTGMTGFGYNTTNTPARTRGYNVTTTPAVRGGYTGNIKTTPAVNRKTVYDTAANQTRSLRSDSLSPVEGNTASKLSANITNGGKLASTRNNLKTGVTQTTTATNATRNNLKTGATQATTATNATRNNLTASAHKAAAAANTVRSNLKANNAAAPITRNNLTAATHNNTAVNKTAVANNTTAAQQNTGIHGTGTAQRQITRGPITVDEYRARLSNANRINEAGFSGDQGIFHSGITRNNGITRLSGSLNRRQSQNINPTGYSGEQGIVRGGKRNTAGVTRQTNNTNRRQTLGINPTGYSGEQGLVRSGVRRNDAVTRSNTAIPRSNTAIPRSNRTRSTNNVNYSNPTGYYYNQVGPDYVSPMMTRNMVNWNDAYGNSQVTPNGYYWHNNPMLYGGFYNQPDTTNPYTRAGLPIPQGHATGATPKTHTSRTDVNRVG